MREKNQISLSVVIPCFNEQESIPTFFPRLIYKLNQLKESNVLSNFEIIVVDDHSTDKSLQMLASLKNIVVLSNTLPQGYGSALKFGFANASCGWVCFMDLDNTYRPEDLDLFLKEIENKSVDFVVGCRSFLSDGMSTTRAFGNWFYKTIAKLFFGSKLMDVCSGYRLFRSNLISPILSIPEDGLNFSIFLSLWSISQDISLKQIKISYEARTGNSKLNIIKDGFNFLKVLFYFKLRESHEVKRSQVKL